MMSKGSCKVHKNFFDPTLYTIVCQETVTWSIRIVGCSRWHYIDLRNYYQI